MAKKCPNCGELMDDNSVFCSNCGTKVDIIQPEQNTNESIENTESETVPVNGFSIAGFVLSVIPLFGITIMIPFISMINLIVMPILSLIFSIIGLKKRDPKDNIGKIFSIIGLSIAGFTILAIIFLIILIILMILITPDIMGD